jgi:hypothetical protein
MDLMKLKTAQWLSTIAAVATIWGLIGLWSSPYRLPLMALVLVLAVGFFVLEMQQDRLAAFFAGVSKFYPLFPQERNVEVFRSVQSEYCYFGVSFSTVLNAFREWHESGRTGNVKVRLLLLDPSESGLLEYQARCELGLLRNGDLTPHDRQLVADTAARSSVATRLVLQTLATLPPGPVKVEVRFHSEKVRHWMHVIDGRLVYVGMLRHGETGLNAPVVILKHRHNKWSLFEYYLEEWEAMWISAKQIPIPPA